MRFGWLLFAPLLLFVMVFAVVPAVGMLIGSVVTSQGVTLHFYQATSTGEYLNSFRTTAALSLYSALVSVVWGIVVTWSLVRTRIGWIQNTLTALSSTMANFAGLPLAVAFMTTLGASGLLTNLLQHALHLNLTQLGWNLASFGGLLVVYTSFLVPLAIVLLLPSIGSMKADWEEASATLGAPTWFYFWRVVRPMLLPSFLGTFALLFANAFSTYVTAFELAGGSVNLIPLQIGYMMNGNVSMNVALGDALAMEEMVVLGLAVALYLVMQRTRAARAMSGTERRSVSNAA
ncbi:ABC transporter permease [Alicyclobacillus sp. ALC3]|uniref:ABC transporter permease n=1 Tax=Alicyclobacillus sp. ALC3 TaxID=2796143 RepID=UPI002379B6D7|nr:hypothetical protein [Alicyclobacillus sp. ALC3]WDL99097.1 hypothetical protein JC200_10860 [Alicyclobacillus sp. ALC3]